MRCIICNCKKHSIFATGILDGAEAKMTPRPKGMDVIKCERCGLFSFSPPPTSEQLREYHSRDYFIAPSEEKQIGYPNYISDDHRRIKIEWGTRMINLLYTHDKQKPEIVKVLDVGCATGFTTYGMSQYQKCKVSAVGIDISQWAINYGRSNLSGVALLNGDITEVDLSMYKLFDYIVFWDSLEHHVNPVIAIKTARILLRRNGLILIQTPDGINAKPDWYYWSPHQHSYIFNAKNLPELLKKCGLKILTQQLSSEADEIVVLARKPLW